MSNLFRSLVFVPGNNPRFLEKAKSLPADIVCFDLEDSVPKDQKGKARTMISDALKQREEYSADVYVRTSAPVSPTFTTGLSPALRADLTSIVQNGLDGIVIPKVNTANEIKEIDEIISTLEAEQEPSDIHKKIHLVPSIESALGVVNCYEIASSSERIVALVFGIFDLLNDMGIEYTKRNPRGAKYSRYKVPVAATAAGVVAIDGIWQDLEDDNGFTKDCEVGRSLGYVGKSVIHPDQIETVHEIFHPSGPEIEWAKKVCEVYEATTKAGLGATVIEGKMIDEVHYKRAKALLEI